jgi:SAM-dependent methyltransferase
MNQSFEKKSNVVDERMQDIFNLVKALSLSEISTVLDIGAGRGELAKHLSEIGKKVTCTGVHISSYLSNVSELHEKFGVNYVECDIENIPFPDESFDLVILCHVLEHCPNVSNALGQARRVLRKGGYLLVFVPPVESVVCGGHISVGWNVGQLMYVLPLNGFEVSTGQFIWYGYNVCGFVRRSEREMPQLRFDQGDISVLAKNGYFPSAINGDASDSFNGDIRSINWPNESNYKFGAQNKKQNLLCLH